jgi:hypothetical protein
VLIELPEGRARRAEGQELGNVRTHFSFKRLLFLSCLGIVPSVEEHFDYYDYLVCFFPSIFFSLLFIYSYVHTLFRPFLPLPPAPSLSSHPQEAKNFVEEKT